MTNVINWHRCKQCNKPCHDNSRFCGECGIAQEGLALDLNMPQLMRHEDRQARKNADAAWSSLFIPIPWNGPRIAALATALVLLAIMVIGLMLLPK